MNTPAHTQAQLTTSSFTPASMSWVQRKCACGGSAGLSGECDECQKDKLMGDSASLVQPKLKISQPNDKYEQEADRVADEVMRMPEPNVQRQIGPKEEKEDEGIQMKPVGDQITPLIQRQVSDEDEEEQAQLKPLSKNIVIQRQNTEANPEFKPKSNQEQAKEALKKAGEAFPKTKLGREIVNKGKDFISTLPGTVITGSAAVGAVTALVAANKELPIKAPAIPLDRLHPGLSVRFTLEGPLRSPTKAMISFSGKFGLPARGRKKPAKTEAEKLREENARRQLEQFESLKTPEEKAREQRRIASRIGKPTPSPSSLSFGVAGQQLGFEQPSPLTTDEPKAGGPFAPPDVKITPEAEMKEEEPKKKEEGEVMRKASSNAHIAGTPSVVHDALRSSAHPLDTNTRAFMESRFGFDFSHVRIHTGTKAVESARAVNGLGYTVGGDVVFNSGQYSPNTNEGRRLIAHELTHVVQQAGANGIRTDKSNEKHGLSSSSISSHTIQRTLEPAESDAARGGLNVPNPAGFDPEALGSWKERQPSEPNKRKPPASRSEVCADCALCSPDQQEFLDNARLRAGDVLKDAATQLRDQEPKVEMVFQSTFDTKNGDTKAMSETANLLESAGKFLLDTSKVWMVEAVDGNIHCDQANNTARCAAGVDSHYHDGNIIICGKLLELPEEENPGQQAPVASEAQSNAPSIAMGQASELPSSKAPSGTEKKNNESKARLVWALAHEAIHHVLPESSPDVYRHEHLYQFLGKKKRTKRAKAGIDLSSLALQNPDSLVDFAFRVSPSGIPGAGAALSESTKLPREPSIRPILGRQRAKLIVSLANEVVEQVHQGLKDLLEQVQSVLLEASEGTSGRPQEWTNFPVRSQEVVDLLTDVGETAFVRPDFVAAERLEAIVEAFQRLAKAMDEGKLVVARRFLFDKLGKRIKISIPKWRAFRTKTANDQLSDLLRALLNEKAAIRGLDRFVLEYARKWGGMQNIIEIPDPDKRANGDET